MEIKTKQEMIDALLEKARNAMVRFYLTWNDDFAMEPCERCPCTQGQEDGGKKTEEFEYLLRLLQEKTGLKSCGICEHIFGIELRERRRSTHYDCPCHVFEPEKAFSMLEKFATERQKGAQ